tara:strand:+ start:497 stop:964 length:468 start_codon:yes stop_codon:yes gene_type:complete
MAAVPNTTTFSLQDVVNAVGGTQNSLQDCFDDAVSVAFNSTYGSISDNDMYAFRDYEEVGVVKTISLNPSQYIDVSASGATLSFTVTSNSSWSVTTAGGFMTPSTTSGSGNGSFTVNVPNNTLAQPRSGTIKVTTTGSGTNRSDTSLVDQLTGFE